LRTDWQFLLFLLEFQYKYEEKNMRRFNKNISVVFPAYDEEENIELCVVIARAILKELVDNFEIIVVDDGSTDNTKKICLQLQEKFPEVKLISKEKNEGYGFALRDAFNASRFDLLFFSDADRQFDIANLRDLLPWVDDHDIVVGFRKNRQDSAKRKFLSWGYNVLAGQMFNLKIKDIDCAFKIFKKNIFESIEIKSNRFFFNTEILAKARRLRYKIKEVGVAHFPRLEGRSTVGFKDILWTLREMKRVYGYIKKTK